MLDSAQCEFLLENNNIQKITDFLTQNGFKNIRITAPQTREDKGKILFLVTETTCHDDYDIGRILHALRKLSVLGINPHRKEQTIQIEDNLKPFYKKRMVECAKPFTEENIQKLASQSDVSLDPYIKEDKNRMKIYQS